MPEKWADHPSHAHNRLLTSIVLNHEERRAVAQAHAAALAPARGSVALLLPQDGLGEWDRAGADLCDKAGLRVFLDALEGSCTANVTPHRIDGHINDAVFAETALAIFDDWCAQGLVRV